MKICDESAFNQWKRRERWGRSLGLGLSIVMPICLFSVIASGVFFPNALRVPAFQRIQLASAWTTDDCCHAARVCALFYRSVTDPPSSSSCMKLSTTDHKMSGR
jgi:hypothetical protein